MKLKIWQIDAFASKPLEGNPAAIVPLESWLEAELMQRIAAENNVAETAYFVKTGAGAYDLRWFAPSLEVDLCGHATLASAWILFNKIDTALNEVRFMTRSGELVVTRLDGSSVVHVVEPPVHSDDAVVLRILVVGNLLIEDAIRLRGCSDVACASRQTHQSRAEVLHVLRHLLQGIKLIYPNGRMKKE